MKKWKCTVCGYIHTGETPPDECPMCSADKSKFVEVTEVDADTSDQEAASSPDTDQVAEKKGPSTIDLIGDIIIKNHLHPITVHFPNGIIPVAVIFLVLAIVFQLAGFELAASFELAAFYNLVFVLVALPPVLISGFAEWIKRYKGARTSVFFAKIACGVVVLAVLTSLVVWRIIDPGVASPESSSRWIYLGLNLILLGAVGLAGHLGGKLAFSGRNR